MAHEISQFDILDRQLLTINPQPRVNKWSDLGEARITRTFLGASKIRVIREQDRKRRAWLLAALVVIAITAAVWQGWITYQKVKIVVPRLSLSERIQVSQPVFAPQTIAPDPHPSEQKSISLIQAEINGLLSGPLPKRPSPVAQTSKRVVASQAVSGQSKIGKAPAQALTSSQSTAQHETSMQQPAKLSVTQPAVKTIAATHLQAKAMPAPVAPLGSSPIKDDSPVSASTRIIQPASPANQQTATNAEPQVNAQAQVNARGTPIIFVEPEESTRAVSK